jgi:hypothetical protein
LDEPVKDVLPRDDFLGGETHGRETKPSKRAEITQVAGPHSPGFVPYRMPTPGCTWMGGRTLNAVEFDSQFASDALAMQMEAKSKSKAPSEEIDF